MRAVRLVAIAGLIGVVWTLVFPHPLVWFLVAGLCLASSVDLAFELRSLRNQRRRLEATLAWLEAGAKGEEPR